MHTANFVIPLMQNELHKSCVLFNLHPEMGNLFLKFISRLVSRIFLVNIRMRLLYPHKFPCFLQGITTCSPAIHRLTIWTFPTILTLAAGYCFVFDIYAFHVLALELICVSSSQYIHYLCMLGELMFCCVSMEHKILAEFKFSLLQAFIMVLQMAFQKIIRKC